MVRQAELSAQGLHETVQSLLRDAQGFAALAEGARARGRPDAAMRIAERLLALTRAV
jgi:UDP-N-acetylglucosamine:LPS N-acetylglucosamine transferase